MKMHPQAFLKTFWRSEIKPQIFVAMSFAPQYQSRYDNVIAPAIRSIVEDGIALTPHRVDISKNGDSILTEISDGIAHSRMILADVSSIGKDSVTGRHYRNANVLYEVGLALACRHSADVLLVRDDHDDFLFDVSTIPHKTLDFTDVGAAKEILATELLGRLKEQDLYNDARVTISIASLSAEEVMLLKQSKAYNESTIWGQETKFIGNWYATATSRLLDKGIIRLAGEFDNGHIAFSFTQLGLIVKDYINNRISVIAVPPPPIHIPSPPEAI